MEDDPEYVDMVREAWLKAPEKKDAPEPKGPPLSEWSGVQDALMDVVDGLGQVREAVIAAGGGKPKDVRPAPRPETALTVMSRSVRIEKRKAAHDTLVGRLLPHRK